MMKLSVEKTTGSFFCAKKNKCSKKLLKSARACDIFNQEKNVCSGIKRKGGDFVPEQDFRNALITK